MSGAERGAQILVDRIESLQEPYRRNTIAWLESLTQEPISNLPRDIHTFLEGLNPVLREHFILNTWLILDKAVRFFGKERRWHKARRQPSPF